METLLGGVLAHPLHLGEHLHLRLRLRLRLHLHLHLQVLSGPTTGSSDKSDGQCEVDTSTITEVG